MAIYNNDDFYKIPNITDYSYIQRKISLILKKRNIIHLPKLEIEKITEKNEESYNSMTKYLQMLNYLKEVYHQDNTMIERIDEEIIKTKTNQFNILMKIDDLSTIKKTLIETRNMMIYYLINRLYECIMAVDMFRINRPLNEIINMLRYDKLNEPLCRICSHVHYTYNDIKSIFEFSLYHASLYYYDD
jgi:hypothetical protein